MNTAVVMLGANLNGEDNIRKIREKLSDYFEIIDESSILVTKPIGKKYKTNFVNQAIKIITDESAKSVVKTFKTIENQMGRSAFTNLRGEVPADIDLIFWNGEKKRNEIFQMAMLEPTLAFLDETDSGLDVDALRVVAQGVNKLKTKENSFVVITHYQRLLDYIVPDVVHVLYKGQIIKTSGKELALEVEENGYDHLISAL